MGEDECGVVFNCPAAPAPLAPEAVGAELLLELLTLTLTLALPLTLALALTQPGAELLLER